MNSNEQTGRNAVTIITKISGLANKDNVSKNYMRQEAVKKELILVHNSEQDCFEQWLELSRLFPMVRIYRLSQGASDGECLNYCVEHSIFENIAIFSEERFYDKDYLTKSANKLNETKSDLTGMKNPDPSNDFIMLPTFVFRKTLFGDIRFTSAGLELDKCFCEECRAKGAKITSIDP